jgi:hypothetical protein
MIDQVLSVLILLHFKSMLLSRPIDLDRGRVQIHPKQILIGPNSLKLSDQLLMLGVGDYHQLLIGSIDREDITAAPEVLEAVGRRVFRYMVEYIDKSFETYPAPTNGTGKRLSCSAWACSPSTSACSGARSPIRSAISTTSSTT